VLAHAIETHDEIVIESMPDTVEELEDELDGLTR
jgi:hypothetical protein